MRFCGRAFVAAIAATTVLSGMAAANAVDPIYTVTAGSAPAGRAVAFTAPSAFFSLDSASRSVLGCGAVTMSATATVGSGLPGAGLIRINGSKVNFPHCFALQNQPLAITGSGMWQVKLVGAADGRNIDARMSKITMHAETTDPDVPCSFDLHGYAQNLRFDNSNSSPALTVRQQHRPGMQITNMVGCATMDSQQGVPIGFGAFAFVFHANNPAYDPLKITYSQ